MRTDKKNCKTKRKETESERELQTLHQQWSGGRLRMKNLKTNQTGLRKEHKATAMYGKEYCLRYK